ncbi:hypothetical protein [Cognatilysobacter lacus]|uniref:Chitin-binding type-2 domain-containing protein n=1 Tax=Cognatilysobacter lacus TaxID=1643323 RepID=A0A5D8Z8I6_9GAMM|nr:hypothetical protein [Lysobacter lacus]TZF88954.1 hypothetical protein FW784_09255 [Lysobacter lacus]
MRAVPMFAFAAVLCLAVPLAPAQTRPQMVQPMMRSPNIGGAQIDRTVLNERRLIALGKKNRALEGRVATLEGALREMRAASEFSCSAVSTSRNGRGATEDCGPYACNYLDGRCRTVAVDSSQCAAGFVWDGSNHCVAPPPPAPDDDCFMGLFC